jgi:TetR/AcrR family transcriptional regulator, ethionamide resistance regulator
VSADEARKELQAAPRRYQRRPRRGEERRVALLRALEELLETKPLASIGIGDLTEAAGVTRSAFYFYFPSKGAAVAALLEDIYEGLLEASGRWHSVDTARGQEELREGFDAVVAYARAHPRLMVATFDAVGSDAEVRELWEHWMGMLAERVTEKIEREREAGRAPQGAAAPSIAMALVAMNERALELEVRAIVNGAEPSDALTEALIEAWERTIYGHVG